MSQKILTDRAAVRTIGDEVQKVLEYHLVYHGSPRALPLHWLGSWVPLKPKGVPHGRPWADYQNNQEFTFLREKNGARDGVLNG